MLSTYTVHDMRPNASGISNVVVIEAHSPEDAAIRALGLDLVRVGDMSKLRAKVYVTIAGHPDVLVRLYARRNGGDV